MKQFIYLLLVTLVSLNIHAKSRPPVASKLTAKVTVRKPRSKTTRYAYENDRKQAIEATLKLTNSNQSSLNSYKAYLYLIGRSAADRKMYTVLKTESATFNLKPRESKEVLTADVVTVYDKKLSYRDGYQYYSYLIIVKDGSGKTFKTHCPKSSFAKISTKIVEHAKKELEFDTKGKGYSRSRIRTR